MYYTSYIRWACQDKISIWIFCMRIRRGMVLKKGTKRATSSWYSDIGIADTKMSYLPNFLKDTFSRMSTDTISFTTPCISDDTTSKTFSVSSHACMLHQYMMIVGSRIIICLWCHWKEAKVPQMVIRLELPCQVMSEPPVEWCRKLHYKFAHWWSMTKCTYGLLMYMNLRFRHHSWYNTSVIFLYGSINCNLE